MKRTKKRSSSPKRLAAIQTSRHFHVSHRKHTGKVLPRSSTSYPLLGMIVLIVGVLIASWTRVVTADVVGSPQIDHQYTVHASVPGPAPTTAATIVSPKAGTHFTARPIQVSGTCPVDADGGYVSLYRNNFYSGSALCDAAGNYQLSTDLFSGANQLVARIFNFTDVAGPDSDPVTVYLDAPVSPPAESGGSEPGPAAQGFSVNPGPQRNPIGSQVAPVTVSTQFAIKGYYTGQPTTWRLDVEGGTSPYAIAADWGDGTTGMVSLAGAGPVQMTHTYAKAGSQEGSYTVKFTVSDADGMQTFLQVLVIVNSRQESPIGSVGSSGGGFGSNTWHVLRNYIWPGYGIVLLMLLSFWLGERREAHVLKPHLKRTRHA